MSTPTAVRVWESEFAVYRKIWRSHALLSFVQPLLYLVGMGVGVGALVDENAASVDSLGGVSYFAYLAPALLATTAMMSAGQASLWQVLDGFMWSNRYRAMAATPLTPGEIATGLSMWHATRVAIGVTGVALVLALFDETRSWGLVLAVPVAVLTGLAFALPLSAWSSTRNGGSSFPTVIRFGLLPMFLFGGAFFPIDQLPDWLQPVAYVTPLWHGIQLCRGLVIDTDDLGNVSVHLAVLFAYVVAGWFACRATFARKVATVTTSESATAVTGAPRRSILLRILPTALLTARRPHRMVERSVMFYRHAWILLVSGFFEPLLYLLSVEVGFAALVGDITVDGQTYPYAQFVAPGLLAVSAMNGAIFDSTGNVFEKIKHSKLYDTVLATPMSAADVALGEIVGALLRGLLYSCAFVVTMWVLGLVGSPMIILAIPVCALIGFAFAAAGMAYTTYMRTWSDLEYVNAITLPLLLFSATFYPASSYGNWSWIVQLSPLYHGVVVVRGCNLGELEWSMLGNLAVLVALSAVGLAITARRIEGLLLR